MKATFLQKHSFVAGLRIVVIVLSITGCVESESIAPVRAIDLPRVNDTFWLEQAVAQRQAEQDPPARARSISLGYIGDDPLAGGVMRDTPMPYVNSPSYFDDAMMAPPPPPPPTACACRVR
jgi:hypothetical protein